MKKEEAEKAIEKLVTKAANAGKSEDAVRFSQAACNIANSLCALKNATILGA